MMALVSSVRKDDSLAGEYRYDCLVEQEAEYFQIDAFCTVLAPSKEAVLFNIAHCFEVAYALLSNCATLEDLNRLPSVETSPVLTFLHVDVLGNFLPVKKVAKRCRERGVISILDVTESVRQIKLHDFSMDILICEKGDYCVVVLAEHFMKTSKGLRLRKRLVGLSR